MRILITALTLSCSVAASAEGFAPWETREGPRAGTDVSIVASPSANVAVSGFAPWYVTRRAVPNAASSNLQMTENMGSVFRPWS